MDHYIFQSPVHGSANMSRVHDIAVKHYFFLLLWSEELLVKLRKNLEDIYIMYLEIENLLQLIGVACA